MRRFQIGKLGVGLLILATMAGCQSSGSLSIIESSESKIPPGKILALAVEAAVPDPDDAMSEVVRRVRTELFGRLVGEGYFQSIVRPPEDADYRMDVKVRDARETSRTTMWLLGPFAKPNSLDLSVSLTEPATGKTVTTFEVSTESASYHLASEADLDDAIDEAVGKVLIAMWKVRKGRSPS